MVFSTLKASRIVAQTLGCLTFLFLISCAGVGGGSVGGLGNSATSGDNGVAAGNAVPGFPSGEVGTKFDPDGTREFGFVEDRRHFARNAPNDYSTELEGHVFHLEKTPSSGEKLDSVPCCEGRWLLVKDTQHQSCGLAPIGAGGAVKVTIGAGDPLVPELIFFLSKSGQAFDPGNADSPDCSSVSPGDFSEFPIGYIRTPQDPIERTLPTKPLPAADGIRSLNSGNDLPTLKIPEDVLRPHVPQDSETSEGEAEVKK